MNDEHTFSLDVAALLNAAPCNYLVLLPDAPTFTIAGVTDSYLEATFTRREDIVGKPLFEVFTDNPNNPAATGVRNLAASLQWVVEHRQEHKMDDQRYDVLDPQTGTYTLKVWSPLNRPVFDGAGHLQYIIHRVDDITRRVQLEASEEQAQQRLRESEASLPGKVAERTAELLQQKQFISSILDASFNGIYTLEALRNEQGVIVDFRYLYVNHIIAQTLGLPAGAVIGNTVLTLLPEVKSNGFFDLFCRVLQTGERVRQECYFESQKFRGWFDYALVPMSGDVLVVTLQDITEQKSATLQIEQQRHLLDKIMRHSPSAITVTEVIRNEQGQVVDGRTIVANAMSEKILGVPLEQMLQVTISQSDPDMLKGPLFQQALQTLHTGEPFQIQYFFAPTGRWLELSVARMDQDHLVNVFADITSIKETQQQLERTVEELRRSNANLEEFAYAASHDMKEPIRKIQFFADRLKGELKDQLTPPQGQLFSRMEHAAQRMGLLIDDLLTYSHVSKGVSHLEEVDLGEKVKNVLEDLELEITEKNARVTVGPLPVITGQRRQLQQLFQNLVANALKYHKAGVAPQISITAHTVKGSASGFAVTGEDAHKAFHLVEVHDNGIGFEQKEAERIFNVFTRLHGNAEYRGTGVGLSIARKVMENHRGYIWAEGNPGEGATFKMLFPVAEHH